MSAATKCGSSHRSCSAVPQRTRPRAVRLLPEAGDQRAQQQRLHEAHPRVRRHLERAKLEQAEAAGGRVRRIQLVDREFRAMRVAGEVGEQVAQQPVDEPGRGRRLPCRVRAPHLLERDLELVEAVVARLVHPRRLARRADEGAREQVRQRRMVLPVGDEALQQIRPAQQRTVGGGRPRPASRGCRRPVPVCRPSSMNFSVDSRDCRASSYSTSVLAQSSSHDDAGCTLTSMTPGSGVTFSTRTRGSRGGV